MISKEQYETELKKEAEFTVKEMIVFFCTFWSGIMIIVFACGAALGSTLNYYYLAASCIAFVILMGYSIKLIFGIRRRREAYTHFVQSPVYAGMILQMIGQHTAVAMV